MTLMGQFVDTLETAMINILHTNIVYIIKVSPLH